jgi:hypothetical protein
MTNTATIASARQFFWAWLIAATLASVAGNVAHALLNPAAASPGIAAAAALVPPIVLLCSTHGVHTLVQSRIVGGAYRAALCITVALALCAFVLSFDALRSLAITSAGMSPSIAWLWPLAIDLSITASTVALLALSNAHRADQLTATPVEPSTSVHVSVHNDVRADAQAGARPSVADLIAREAAHDDDWSAHLPTAERIIGDGITRIDRVKVAQVLTELSGGAAPSMVARKLGVGYTTVTRIHDHSQEIA